MSKEGTGEAAIDFPSPSRRLTPHRLIDSPISTPCSRWEKYKTSRTSWGINVLGSFFLEIEATDGTVGFATGFGGRLHWLGFGLGRD